MSITSRFFQFFFLLFLNMADICTVGVTYVDYEHDQKRHPKKSAKSLKPLFDSLIKKD